MSQDTGSSGTLRMETATADGVTTVSVAGRLNHTSSGDFQTQMEAVLSDAATARGGVIVDLSRLEFISSAGLRQLTIADKTQREAGGKLVITGLHGVVEEIVRISRLDTILTVTDTVESARSLLLSSQTG